MHLDDLKEVEELLQSRNVDLAKLYYATITDDNLIESNKLLANEIYLDNVNQDYFSTLNTTDINKLENIAFQPGIIGGEAVYRGIYI